MVRFILGIIKGLFVGLLLGVAVLVFAPQDGFVLSFFSYVGAALCGAFVGLVCGRPPWKTETFWVPLLRVLFGAILGGGLYALAHAFVPDLSLGTISALSPTPLTLASGPVLIPMIGVLYGAFVELDDGASPKQTKALPEAEPQS